MKIKPHTDIQNKEISYQLRLEKYIKYLTLSRIDKVNLNNIDKEKISLIEFISQIKSDQNRTLFHMTITYKQYADRIYTEKDVNIFFKNMYLHHLLPYLHKPYRFTTNRQREYQPICLTFIDEHNKPHYLKDNFLTIEDKLRREITKENESNYLVENEFLYDPKPTYIEYPLHHHCIIAIHQEQLKRFSKFIGTDTLVVKSSEQEKYKDSLGIIKTSDIRPCEPMRLLYASKKLNKYPEFQIFPNSFKRRNNTNKIYDGTNKNIRKIVSTTIHEDPSDINTPIRKVRINVNAK